jgi:hypothetical protein
MRSPLCLPDTLRCRLSASFAKRAILRHEQGRSRSDVMSVARKSYSIHNSSSIVFAVRACKLSWGRRRRAVEVQDRSAKPKVRASAAERTRRKGAVVRLVCALWGRLNDLSEYHRRGGEEHGDEKTSTQCNTTFATSGVSKQTGGGPLVEGALPIT